MEQKAAVGEIPVPGPKREFRAGDAVMCPSARCGHVLVISTPTPQAVCPLPRRSLFSLRDAKEVLDTAEVVRQTLKRTHQSEGRHNRGTYWGFLEQAENTRLMFIIAMMGLSRRHFTRRWRRRHHEHHARHRYRTHTRNRDSRRHWSPQGLVSRGNSSSKPSFYPLSAALQAL